MTVSSTFFKDLSVNVAYLLERSNITAPPVNIKQIVADCGAKAAALDLGEEISGVLIVDNGQKTIGFNVNHHRYRRRFTIAHELGHLLYHVKTTENEVFVDRDFLLKYRGKKSYSIRELKQEREANIFAAAILMPEEFIQKEIKKSEYSNLSEAALITKLAKTFDVSVPAMSIRFSDLHIFQY